MKVIKANMKRSISSEIEICPDHPKGHFSERTEKRKRRISIIGSHGSSPYIIRDRKSQGIINGIIGKWGKLSRIILFAIFLGIIGGTIIIGVPGLFSRAINDGFDNYSQGNIISNQGRGLKSSSGNVITISTNTIITSNTSYFFDDIYLEANLTVGENVSVKFYGCNIYFNNSTAETGIILWNNSQIYLDHSHLEALSSIGKSFIKAVLNDTRFESYSSEFINLGLRKSNVGIDLSGSSLHKNLTFIFMGNRVKGNYTGISLTYSSYCYIENNYVNITENKDWTEIHDFSMSSSTNITILNNTIYYGSAGIYIYGDSWNITVANNRLYNQSFYDIYINFLGSFLDKNGRCIDILSNYVLAKSTGIYLGNLFNSSITGNHILATYSGIFISTWSYVAGNVLITNNTIDFSGQAVSTYNSINLLGELVNYTISGNYFNNDSLYMSSAGNYKAFFLENLLSARNMSNLQLNYNNRTTPVYVYFNFGNDTRTELDFNSSVCAGIYIFNYTGLHVKNAIIDEGGTLNVVHCNNSIIENITIANARDQNLFKFCNNLTISNLNITCTNELYDYTTSSLYFNYIYNISVSNISSYIYDRHWTYQEFMKVENSNHLKIMEAKVQGSFAYFFRVFTSNNLNICYSTLKNYAQSYSVIIYIDNGTGIDFNHNEVYARSDEISFVSGSFNVSSNNFDYNHWLNNTFGEDGNGDGICDSAYLLGDIFGDLVYDHYPVFIDDDNDKLDNLQEEYFGSNPHDNDTDNDGVSDYGEIRMYHTDPNNPDSDGDKLTDYEEIFHIYGYATDPNNPDTDGDLFNDYAEIIAGSDPTNSTSYPGGNLNSGNEEEQSSSENKGYLSESIPGVKMIYILILLILAIYGILSIYDIRVREREEKTVVLKEIMSARRKEAEMLMSGEGPSNGAENENENGNENENKSENESENESEKLKNENKEGTK
ncbi:MAG: right-handed parallel beta-helix repeat-containing protein [Promethearchaeota archaeon]